MSPKATSAEDELATLRQHLLGADYEDLLALKSSLDDPIEFSKRLSTVISESISLRISQDNSLADALSATIEGAIKQSIATDPQALADSLYPVMGPAIRKSISEALSQMLENINQVLEQGLSPKALKWRFDAWRTGRSYSEIVISNTLDYQVEQVFLIHGEASLLIHHLEAEFAIAKDPDMVSGMLSAIQDFIVDSFSTGDGDSLQSMRLGDLTVIVEKAPQLVLAAVVRGNVPTALRTLLVETVENLQRSYAAALIDYDGDNEPFTGMKPILEPCLQVKHRVIDKKIPWLGILAVTAVFCLASLLGFNNYRLEQGRAEAVAALRNEPGIIVSNKLEIESRFVVIGLRDPLARTPVEVVGDERTNLLEMEYSFQPFIGLNPELILKRAYQIVSPPPEVELDISGNILHVEGLATIMWLEKLQSNWTRISGIDAIDIRNLEVSDPIMQRMVLLQEQVQMSRINFDKSSSDLDNQETELVKISSWAFELTSLADDRDINVMIEIIGHTDDTGDPRLNRTLEAKRAAVITQHLVDAGVGAQFLSDHSARDYQANNTGWVNPGGRMVSFIVIGIAEE